MNKTSLQKIKNLLLAQRKEIIQNTNHKIDIDTDGDETDAIQGNMLIEMNNQLNVRNNAKLIQIDEALQRIQNKSYGICQDCEEEISEKRLLMNPYFQICVFCAEEREVEEKQRRR